MPLLLISHLAGAVALVDMSPEGLVYSGFWPLGSEFGRGNRSDWFPIYDEASTHVPLDFLWWGRGAAVANETDESLYAQVQEPPAFSLDGGVRLLASMIEIPRYAGEGTLPATPAASAAGIVLPAAGPGATGVSITYRFRWLFLQLSITVRSGASHGTVSGVALPVHGPGGLASPVAGLVTNFATGAPVGSPRANYFTWPLNQSLLVAFNATPRLLCFSERCCAGSFYADLSREMAPAQDVRPAEGQCAWAQPLVRGFPVPEYGTPETMDTQIRVASPWYTVNLTHDYALGRVWFRMRDDEGLLDTGADSSWPMEFPPSQASQPFVFAVLLSSARMADIRNLTVRRLMPATTTTSTVLSSESLSTGTPVLPMSFDATPAPTAGTGFRPAFPGESLSRASHAGSWGFFAAAVTTVVCAACVATVSLVRAAKCQRQRRRQRTSEIY